MLRRDEDIRKEDLWELVELGELRHSMDEPSVQGRTESVLGRTKGEGNSVMVKQSYTSNFV